MHLSRFAQKKYNELNEVLNCPIIIFNNWITFHNRFLRNPLLKTHEIWIEKVGKWNEGTTRVIHYLPGMNKFNSEKVHNVLYDGNKSSHLHTPTFLWVNNERNVLPAFWPISFKMVFLDIHRLFLLFGQVQNSIHICLFKFSKDDFLF